MATDAELIDAAKRGDGAFLAANLADYKPGIGPDPRLETIRDARGYGLLDIAAENKHTRAVCELILNKGAWRSPAAAREVLALRESLEREKDRTMWGRTREEYQRITSTLELLCNAAYSFKAEGNIGLFKLMGLTEMIAGPAGYSTTHRRADLAGELDPVFLEYAVAGALPRYAAHILETKPLGGVGAISHIRTLIPTYGFTLDNLFGGKWNHTEVAVAAFAEFPDLGKKLADAAKLYNAVPQDQRTRSWC